MAVSFRGVPRFQVGKLDSLELTGETAAFKFQLTLGHRLLEMNAKLDRLIEREIGVDDGSFLPGPGVLWRGA